MSFLSFFTKWYSTDLAIDLGTANTLTYVKNQGVVLDEPSVVAIHHTNGITNNKKLIACGRGVWFDGGRYRGGTTEVGIISLGGMVYKGSVRIGGDKFDEAIVNYIRRNYGMLIGDQMAEKLKKHIGVAFPSAEFKEMEVTGRNLSQGIPQSFAVSASEILEALTDPLNGLVMAIKTALEHTPPELSSDIAERGIMLTGGGALLRDLYRLISEETGLPVMLADDPLTCVVRGCGMALERLDGIAWIFTRD